MSEAGRQEAEELLEAHGFPSEPLQSLHGWSNQVWLAPAHVVRISSGRFRESFRHEVDVLRLVKDHVPAPEAIAYGRQDDREWMISVRVPGESLLMRWATMDRSERHEAIRQFAAALKALHQVTLAEGFQNPWMLDAIDDPAKAADLYHAAPRHYGLTLRSLREKNLAREKLLSAADEFLAERLLLFVDDAQCLVHGDAHFNNVLWDGQKLTLLDFEASFKGPRDMDLDTIIRFTRNPVQFFGQGSEAAIQPAEFQDVLPWLENFYPEIFETPRLQERLQVYDMMMMMHQLHHFPAGHEYDPRPALEEILGS